MFNILKKKEVSIEKVRNFCDWFTANNKRIIDSVNNSSTNHDEMMKVLDEVENELKKIYKDGYNGNIEFEYGFNGKKWDLNLYHLNNKFLIKATTLIADNFANSLSDTWIVNVGK